MANIQTLTLQRKKYALLPMNEYEKLLELIDDLEDLAEVKKREHFEKPSVSAKKKSIAARKRANKKVRTGGFRERTPREE